MGAATPTALTPEQIRVARDELTDEIVNGTDEHWQRYANQLASERALGLKMGMYKRWSSNNMFYLKAQCKRRQASVKGLYAGVDQWRQRGRSVRDGEQPFIIYGKPTFRSDKTANTQPTTAAGRPAASAGATAAQAASKTAKATGSRPAKAAGTGKPVSGYIPPPTIEVYDWTQTVADDPDFVEPDWGVPLAYGNLDTLHQLARTAPVPVKFADIASRNEHGWLDASGITIDSSLPVGNRIFTLLHELAHHYLGHLERVDSTAAPVDTDGEQYSAYAVCEQEAALTQFLVMKMLGLDEAVGNNVTQAAGSYLRSWMSTDSQGNLVPIAGHKKKRKLIVERFDAAMAAADQIVTGYLAGADPAETAG